MNKQKTCKQEENLVHCTCTYTSCDKRGVCCDCIKSHRDKGEIPGCLFPPKAEATYDRSIEKFIEVWSKK